MIGGRLAHLLADALLILRSHQGEQWRCVYAVKMVQLAPEWVPPNYVLVYATSSPGFVWLFVYFSVYLMFSNYYFHRQLTCISVVGLFLSNDVVCVRLWRPPPPQDFKGYKWSPWLLWQTVLYADKWMLKMLRWTEGKLDSRLITEHTWPYRNTL